MSIQAVEGFYPIHHRAAFAGLEGDWAWFDNAGGSFTLREVIRRVSDYMQSTPVQLGGSYPQSRLAAERQQSAAGEMAAFINAKDGSEIVFGGSSTALTWQVARAMLPCLEPGDEVVITLIDHEANRSPWLWLAKFGITVRTWHVDPASWSLSLDHLETLLNERTRLVCFSQCSNILGKIEPVAEITRRVHAAGARVFVDGVAYAPHRRVDVRQWDVDFYVCSLYKLFGPHIGMLYGKRDALLALGNINHEYLANDALPYKLQPGGACYELAWGATGITDYFRDWQQATGRDPFDLIAKYENRLLEPLLDMLNANKSVQLFGEARATTATRLPIVAFRHDKLSSFEIVETMNAQKLAVRHGHFHARRLLEHLGVPIDDGVVRISLAHYNTPEEVARLVSALEKTMG